MKTCEAWEKWHQGTLYGRPRSQTQKKSGLRRVAGGKPHNRASADKTMAKIEWENQKKKIDGSARGAAHDSAIHTSVAQGEYEGKNECLATPEVARSKQNGALRVN